MYNGHKNWNHWNVSLWLSNDEELYRMVCRVLRTNTKDQAAEIILAQTPSRTPDNAKYTKTAIRAALVDWS